MTEKENIKNFLGLKHSNEFWHDKLDVHHSDSTVAN